MCIRSLSLNSLILFFFFSECRQFNFMNIDLFPRGIIGNGSVKSLSNFRFMVALLFYTVYIVPMV